MLSDDFDVYRTCMDKVRERIATIQRLVASPLPMPNEPFLTTELIFVQFRKVLELIAYASLSANKEKYAEAHKDYQRHWRAKDMLGAIERVNKGFYPQPLLPPIIKPDGTRHFPRLVSGFLTQADFVVLYDATSEILHMRNPFSLKDPVTNIKYSIPGWVQMIQRLLAMHVVRFPDGSSWIVQIPHAGEIRLVMAEPVKIMRAGVDSNRQSVEPTDGSSVHRVPGYLFGIKDQA